MRRSALGLIIIFAALILASCSTGGSTGNPMLDSRVAMLNEQSKIEKQKCDERMEQIIDAIKNQDGDAIKSLYSEKALKGADNFDDDTEMFFDFIEGNIVSWERDSANTSESIEDGKRRTMYSYSIDIETDVDTYRVDVFDYNVDTIEPENEGVYTLLIRTIGYTENLGPWQDRMRPGFYIPEALDITVKSRY